VPQAELLKLLEGIADEAIGMDSSVVPLKYLGLFLISTTDYFYPSVDDPYVQGKIGAANVLSDLYAMGVVDCDNVLMILAESTDMSKEERHTVTSLMIKGFHDLVQEAGSRVTGGQTVMNPWPIIGGTAMSTCKQEDFIMPEHAVEGDVLVLTKPLGTQVAVNVHQWISIEAKWSRVSDFMTKDDAERAYQVAMDSMARLNRNGARLMHKYGAHAATDVTGFGILGHSRNLARNQKAAINFEIHSLPIIKHMKEVNEKVNFKLTEGFSAETSGGLLVCLPANKAEAFCKEIEEIDKHPAWIIGRVVKSDADRTQNTSKIVDNPTIISV
jgi:selenide,water dikinase